MGTRDNGEKEREGVEGVGGKGDKGGKGWMKNGRGEKVVGGQWSQGGAKA